MAVPEHTLSDLDWVKEFAISLLPSHILIPVLLVIIGAIALYIFAIRIPAEPPSFEDLKSDVYLNKKKKRKKELVTISEKPVAITKEKKGKSRQKISESLPLAASRSKEPVIAATIKPAPETSQSEIPPPAADNGDWVTPVPKRDRREKGRKRATPRSHLPPTSNQFEDVEDEAGPEEDQEVAPDLEVQPKEERTPDTIVSMQQAQVEPVPPVEVTTVESAEKSEKEPTKQDKSKSKKALTEEESAPKPAPVKDPSPTVAPRQKSKKAAGSKLKSSPTLPLTSKWEIDQSVFAFTTPEVAPPPKQDTPDSSGQESLEDFEIVDFPGTEDGEVTSHTSGASRRKAKRLFKREHQKQPEEMVKSTEELPSPGQGTSGGEEVEKETPLETATSAASAWVTPGDSRKKKQRPRRDN